MRVHQLGAILLLAVDVICQSNDTLAPTSTSDANATLAPTLANRTIAPIAPTLDPSPAPAATLTLPPTQSPTPISYLLLPSTSVCYDVRDTNVYPRIALTSMTQYFQLNKLLEVQFKLMSLSPPLPCLLAVKTLLCALMLPALLLQNTSKLPGVALPSRELCMAMRTTCDERESPRHLLERRKLIDVWLAMAAASVNISAVFNATGIIGVLNDCDATIGGLNGTAVAVKGVAALLTSMSAKAAAASNGSIPMLNFLNVPAFPNTTSGAIGMMNTSAVTNISLFRPCMSASRSLGPICNAMDPLKQSSNA